MTADAPESPLNVLKTPFVMKTVAFVLVLALFGFAAANTLNTDKPFVGIAIGMAWSLAGLIVLVGALVFVASTVSQLRGA